MLYSIFRAQILGDRGGRWKVDRRGQNITIEERETYIDYWRWGWGGGVGRQRERDERWDSGLVR